MADYVKSIDPNHMVTTGEQGYDTTTAGYSTGSYNNQAWLFNGHKGVSFSENTADPNIDFASIHLYPEYWNLSSTAGNSWIADHVRIARQLGKPLVIGEFGYSSNPAAVYDQWLQTADVENAGGSLMWQLMCQSCYAMRDNFGVAYPPASAVSEVLVHAAQVANAKSGSASPPPSSPTSVSFTIGTTSATPSVVGTGQGVAIAAAVTAAASSTALVDLEVYDTAGTKVAQQIYAAQSFNAGQTRTYTWTWPGAAAAGTYTVKVGVVSNDWSTLYAWKDPAATVTVQASGGAAVSFVVKSTSVKPTSVRRGGTVKIRMSVQAKAAASAILDLEIFDAKGARVAQTSCSRTFAANETLSCSWAYSVPSSLAKGRYTVKVGVFSTSGSTVYAWVDSAGTFSVQ
jgi:methionine-rich copper-binding protein CopC